MRVKVLFIAILGAAVVLSATALIMTFEYSRLAPADFLVINNTQKRIPSKPYSNPEIGLAIDPLAGKEVFTYPFHTITEIRIYNSDQNSGDSTDTSSFHKNVASIIVEKDIYKGSFVNYYKDPANGYPGRATGTTPDTLSNTPATIVHFDPDLKDANEWVVLKNNFIYRIYSSADDISQDKYPDNEAQRIKEKARLETEFNKVLAAIHFIDPQIPPESPPTTYLSPKFPYQVTYLSNWLVETEEDGSISFISPRNQQLAKSEDVYPPYTEGPVPINVIINRYENLGADYFRGSGWEGMKASYKSWTELINDKNSGFIKKGETTVDGARALELIEGGLGETFAVVFQHDNGFYKITFPQAENKAALLPEELALLKSFKFTK